MEKKENQKPEPDDKEQSQRFVETARKLEVHEDESPFNRAIEAVITTSVIDKSQKQAPQKS